WSVTGVQTCALPIYWCAARQCRNHQPVPRCDNLVIEMRTRALRPHLAQLTECRQQPLVRLFRRQQKLLRRFCQRPPLREDVLSAELPVRVELSGNIAVFFDSELRREKRKAV